MICAAFFAAMIVITMGGNALQAAGAVRDPGAWRTPFLILVFVLFLGFGFSAIPVMVKTVVGLQRKIGNEDIPAVNAALRAENWIIYAIWALMAAGLSIAIPAAISGGLFNPPEPETGGTTGPKTANDEGLGSSSGTLVARPGMLISDMVRLSSLAIDPQRQSTWTGSVIGGQVFDFRIAGTGIVFQNCRYYFVAPYTRERLRIESVNIGVSPSAVGRAELARADVSLRHRLKADGWLAGHEEYRDEQDRALHGGTVRGPEGALWLKNGIVLRIGARRVDDAEGENAQTAGRWIQFIDLWQRDDYPNIERYAFSSGRE
jgi:hypothetical protein